MRRPTSPRYRPGRWRVPVPAGSPRAGPPSRPRTRPPPSGRPAGRPPGPPDDGQRRGGVDEQVQHREHTTSHRVGQRLLEVRLRGHGDERVCGSHRDRDGHRDHELCTGDRPEELGERPEQRQGHESERHPGQPDLREPPAREAPRQRAQDRDAQDQAARHGQRQQHELVLGQAELLHRHLRAEHAHDAVQGGGEAEKRERPADPRIASDERETLLRTRRGRSDVPPSAPAWRTGAASRALPRRCRGRLRWPRSRCRRPGSPRADPERRNPPRRQPGG